MRSDEEILEQTEKLASFLCRQFFDIEADSQHQFRSTTNPRGIKCWNAAREIQLMLTDTDVDDALDNLEL